MLDKKEILNYFSEKDKLLAINLYEKYKLSFQKDIPIVTKEFYPPSIWKVFQTRLQKSDFKIESYGVFSESERRMLFFNNKYNDNFECCCIRIRNKSKFKNISHRDYLGSILSLGINRTKLGDLVVKDDDCYVAVSSDIKDYILNNLKNVSNCPCNIIEVNDLSDLPKVDFKEMIILVPKLRIDAIVAKISNVSREKANEYIERGLVLVDYSEVSSKSKEIKKDQRITIRGKGKFILGDIVSTSKSGKYKVIIKKYT